MKAILIGISMFISLAYAQPWLTDMDVARQQAQKKHAYIVLNFSGSDWCIPCMRMHKEVFETEEFLQFAQNKLVLINADFPRLKKNALDKAQQKKNDALAEQYNPKGIFPITLLLDEKGNVVKKWEGFYGKGVANFIDEINNTSH